MGFGHVQGTQASNSTTTSQTLTLGSNPGVGDLVCVVCHFNTTTTGIVATGVTVVDANGNAYTKSNGSPFVRADASVGHATSWMFYLYPAPSNASLTINITWTNSNFGDFYAEDFSVSGGIAVYDSDTGVGSIISGSGGAVTTPTFTPRGNDLLYAGCLPNAGSITAPAGGASAGPWTGAAGGISTNGGMCEYVLSATAATSANFTDSSGNDPCITTIMGFLFVPNVPSSGPGNVRREVRVQGY